MTTVTSLAQAAAKKAIKEYFEARCVQVADQIILELYTEGPCDYGDGLVEVTEATLRDLLIRAYARGGAEASKFVKDGLTK